MVILNMSHFHWIYFCFSCQMKKKENLKSPLWNLVADKADQAEGGGTRSRPPIDELLQHKNYRNPLSVTLEHIQPTYRSKCCLCFDFFFS